MIAATASGNLAIVGPLAGDARISGTIDIARAEINVPDSFGGGPAGIDVIHRNPPPGVVATLQRARANDGTPVPTARPSVLQLDVTVNAPNQIFVRGRGLDAELGGSVRLLGPVTNVQPVGAFEMIRGRLGILGQRIDFEEGTITLIGDLDPVLNFVASSSGSGDITVFITVSGRVSDLDISFSSQPQLPEDEVLAQLIFNRSIGELSPFQIAQLAAAAAELAGGGNSSLLGSLRGAAGLDDLDIVTDSEGNAAVRAGRYIQDNIYLGVEAGAGGTARGTINLDITDELTARGAVGSDGDSSLGLFFERDY
jgi:translocation and assembly module TamB